MIEAAGKNLSQRRVTDAAPCDRQHFNEDRAKQRFGRESLRLDQSSENRPYDCFRYFPIEEQTRKWGLNISGAGRNSVPPNSDFLTDGHPKLYECNWTRGRVLPEYQFVLLADGSGTLESSGFGSCEVQAGQVMILFPGVWHRFRPQSETGWTCYWMGACGSFVDHLDEHRYLKREQPIVSVKTPAMVQKSFEQILELSSNPNENTPRSLSIIAMEILESICGPHEPEPHVSESVSGEDAVHDRMVAEAVRIIWNSSDHALSVEKLVAQLPTSRRSLERRFQQQLGRTILSELTRCRLERAKSLLRETNLPIKQVSVAAGYPSPEALTRGFQRELGTTPVAFRDHR